MCDWLFACGGNGMPTYWYILEYLLVLAYIFGFAVPFLSMLFFITPDFDTACLSIGGHNVFLWALLFVLPQVIINPVFIYRPFRNHYLKKHNLKGPYGIEGMIDRSNNVFIDVLVDSFLDIFRG